MAPAASTPVDLVQVRQVLLDLLGQGEVNEAVEMVVSLLGQVLAENREIEFRLAQLLRHSYGRRSERVDPRQLALLLKEVAKGAVDGTPGPSAAAGEAGVSDGAKDAPALAATGQRRAASKPTGRQVLPDSLPRETVVHRPDPKDLECTQCGAQRARIGVETSEVLEFEPAKLKVIEHQREKYACPRCKDKVVVGPVGEKVIERGLPGPGLLAYVLVSKYRDHLPLNRQVEILGRSGVTLSKSTLCGWVAAGAELLEPFACAIFEQALGAHVMQGDDTGIRVLDPDHPLGSKRGHMWGFVGDQRWVAFRYTPTWEGEKARALVAGREGYFQVDGYAGFDAMFNAPGAKVIEVGCHAHSRRKFVAAFEAGDARAAIALSLFRKLYVVEAEARDRGLSADTRKALRAERSAPILKELGRWVAELHGQTPPKSPLGKALTYAINQWRALNRFLEDGSLQLDNNEIERGLRPIAVGRKNYMFAGSDAGAERAATIYTVIGTCVRQGVDPWAYLQDVFAEIARGVKRDVRDVLPDAWFKRHPEARLRSPSALKARAA